MSIHPVGKNGGSRSGFELLEAAGHLRTGFGRVISGGVPRSEPALFRRYPGLVGRLPHRPFLAGATPVEPLALEGVPAGRLFVKRDDQSCGLYGGNKPRKLEFVIGDCLARGTRRIVTTGGLGTHHGLATTILGREVGLETSLVLVDQPVTDEVRESLALLQAHGAELVYGGSVAGAGAQCLRLLIRGRWRGERVRLVPPGGSGAVGNLGFVSAAFELAEQIAEGALPSPGSIFVAVGTGGTQAGLVLGLRLAGISARVIGVLATDLLAPHPARLARAARRTRRRLRDAGAEVPAIALGRADFPVVRAQLGPGYGAATAAGREARRAAAAAGLALEDTYTAKCLAEIRARAAAGTLGPGAVLFWNTHNGVDCRARAPRPLDPASLPTPFRRFMEPRN